jgi:hypothetical protein
MVTKRQLGIGIIILGLGGDLALLIIGRLGMGAWGGIGPFERAMLVAGLAMALAGVPLLRLGDMPAARTISPRYGGLSHLPSQSRRAQLMRWIGQGFKVLALLAFLGYLIVYIAYAVELFRWPYDYDQGESFELYDAVLHSQGKWPYRDGSTYPFYASNYPPFFHLLMIPLFPIFGQRLLAGRVLSFSITLLTAGAIGWTVRRRTGGVYIPLMCALGYTASNFVYHIGPLCRQHLTMVFLEVLTVLFIAKAGEQWGDDEGRDSSRSFGMTRYSFGMTRYSFGVTKQWFGMTRRAFGFTSLGLLFLLLAGYTKQLAVFTAAAVFGYLFLLDPKRCMVLVVAFGAVFGLIFFGLNQATDGQWWLNTIAANVNAYQVPQLVALTRSWLKVHIVFLVLAMGYVLYELYIDRLSVYSLWFAFAIGTGLMSGKWGAGEAYWVTAVAAALVLSGFALGKLRDWIQHQRPQWSWGVGILIPGLLLIQATRMLHLPTAGPLWGPVARVLGVAGASVYADYPYYDSVGYTQVGHFMLPRDYEGGARIMAYVKDTPNPIFSEEAAFSMLADKPVVTNPTQLLNLYNNSLLDTGPLETMIRQEAFGLVIMRAQFYPPPVLAAIGQHYALAEHVSMNGFQYIVMQPLGIPE